MRLWTVFKGMARIAKCEQPHTRPSLQRVEPVLEPHTAEPQPQMCSRPAVSILKLFEYELDETVWTGGRDCTVTTAEEVHLLKSAVLLNKTVPTPRQIWREATRLANYFDSVGITTVLTVPGARDLTAPDDLVEGKSLKVPAKHVRYAASTAPDVRWSGAMARDPAFWWPTEGSTITPAPCAGLGLLIGGDVIVLDFDRLADEDSLAFFEHIASLCPVDSPMEFTRNGAHLFFRQTDYGREAFPFVTHFGAIDVVTVASTGTFSYVEVSPSKFKRTVLGRRLGDGPLPGIPDTVVDALAAHQRACLKRKAGGEVLHGGEAACEPLEKMPRPAMGAHWLHGLTADEAKAIFTAVGMHLMVAGTKGPAATTFMRLVAGARCYLGRCVRVDHSNDFQISTHSATGHVTVHHVGKTFRIVTADGAESDERQSFAFAPLTTDTLRVLHAAWSRWPAAKCKAAADGAVFALQSAEGYEWRDFTPWATSPGPMRLSQDLWAAPDTQETARGPKPWRDARELERLGLHNLEYLRERGPLADASTRYGDSAYSWSFNSTDRCPSCSRVHDKAYTVFSFESDVSKPVLFAECTSRGVGLYDGQLPPLTEAASQRETRRLKELGAMFAEPAEAASVHPTLTDSAEDTARFGALLGSVKSANGQRDALVEACAAVFSACWDAPWVARARVRPVEPGRYFAETYAQRVKAAGYCSKTGFYVVCRGDKGEFRVAPKRKSGVPLLMPSAYAPWCVNI